MALTVDFFKDLNWFSTLSQFNGVVYYGVKSMLFLFQKNFNNYSIVHLEMLNIGVALKAWAVGGHAKNYTLDVITWL